MSTAWQLFLQQSGQQLELIGTGLLIIAFKCVQKCLNISSHATTVPFLLTEHSMLGNRRESNRTPLIN